MKKIILILFLINSSIINAQSVDIHYNYMYANSQIPQGVLIPIYTSNFGIDYNFGKHEWLNYTIGLNYESKGSEYDNWRGYQTNHFNYLILKPMLNLEFPSNNIQIGPSFGLLTAIDFKPNDSFNRDMMNMARKYEIGLTTVVQQHIFRYENLSSHLRVEGNYGLTSYSRYGGAFSKYGYFRQFTFGVGFGIRWHYKDGN